MRVVVCVAVRSHTLRRGHGIVGASRTFLCVGVVALDRGGEEREIEQQCLSNALCWIRWQGVNAGPRLSLEHWRWFGVAHVYCGYS